MILTVRGNSIIEHFTKQRLRITGPAEAKQHERKTVQRREPPIVALFQCSPRAPSKLM
jgi:hypothetical protein